MLKRSRGAGAIDQWRAERDVSGRAIRRHCQTFNVESVEPRRKSAVGHAGCETEIVRAFAVQIVHIPGDQIVAQVVVASNVAERIRRRAHPIAADLRGKEPITVGAKLARLGIAVRAEPIDARPASVAQFNRRLDVIFGIRGREI